VDGRSRWCAGSSKTRYPGGIADALRSGDQNAQGIAKRTVQSCRFSMSASMALLRIAGGARIGNPHTSSRHQLPAALYAPLRVVLFEDEHGRGIFAGRCLAQCCQ